MINVKKYDLTDFEDLLKFCREQYDENHPVSKNMWDENWKERPETLPFILNSKTRFFGNRGEFYILRDDEIIIGCGGIYISEFSPRVGLAGTRTWLDKKYRTSQHIKNYLLPVQKDWAIEHNLDVVALTFNNYNAGIRRLFTIGQATGTRTPRHLFSDNFNMLEYMVMIQHVPQWVIYENLSDFRFDWETIKSEQGSRQI